MPSARTVVVKLSYQDGSASEYAVGPADEFKLEHLLAIGARGEQFFDALIGPQPELAVVRVTFTVWQDDVVVSQRMFFNGVPA